MTQTPRILGTGSAVPEGRLTNDELAARFAATRPHVTAEWIEAKTGVVERRVSRPGVEAERNSRLAAEASRQALDMAGLDPTALDVVVYATCTPDTLIPSAASWLQRHLGAPHAWAFDLNAACAGFLQGLAVARSLLLSGAARTALVLGADVITAFVDPDDHRTAVLFGDGAGAVVLSSEGEAGILRLLDTRAGSHAERNDDVVVPAGGSARPGRTGCRAPREFTMHMRGRAVREAAMDLIPRSCAETLDAHGLAQSDIDWLVPHQANLRIVEAVADTLGVPRVRVATNIQRRGNTSGATVPTLLDGLVRSGRLQPQQTLLAASFGAGYTFATALLRS